MEMVSNCHLELQTEGLLWEGSGRGPRGAQPTGEAPCTGLSRVFSEGIGLWLPVTVLFPGQCRGLGGALTQGQPLTPGHLRPSHAHVCCSSKPAAHNTPDARDVGTLPPSTWRASRFCRQSREQTLRPGAFWAGEAPCTAPVSCLLPLRLHAGQKPPPTLAILPERRSFLFSS